MPGFQTQVKGAMAPAIEGDFADHNPRSVVLAGPGGIVAGPAGLIVGRFAWLGFAGDDLDETQTVATNFGVGAPAGFLARDGVKATLTTFLAQSGMTVLPGKEVALFSEGSFWAKNNGTTQVEPGSQVFANYADGTVVFGAALTASVTAAIAAGSASFTGAIVDNELTVTAVASGTIYPGAALSGTGVGSGTVIQSQLSGTTGGVGVYVVSIGEQTVASESMTTAHGVMTVSAVGSGTLGIGDTITSGSGAVVGTAITALGTGTGLTGTYIVNNNTVVSSTTIAFGDSYGTKWVSASGAAPGELVKITTHKQG